MDINELLFVGVNKYGQAGIGEKHHNKHFPLPKSYAFSIFIKQIACGAHHAALLTIDGNIYTMGSNIHGALGSNPSLNYSFVPTLVDALSDVTKIDCGPFHMCALSDGQLYSWGKGIDGQLGHGNTKNLSRPLKVEALGREVENVSCGTNHTLVLTCNRKDQSKSAYAFGNGIYGQLGAGQSRNSYQPVRVKLEKVEAIAAGQNHSLFVSEGKIYACGDNSTGQLGTAFTRKFVAEPTSVELTYKANVVMIQARKCSLALTDSGDIYVWGLKPNSPPKLLKNDNGEQLEVIDIRAGTDQLYGLTTDGSLYSWTLSKALQRDLYLTCRSEKVVANGRAVLDFSVGDGYLLVLGDIVRQIPYSSVAPPLLSCFEDLDSQPSHRSDSFPSEQLSQREMISESQFLQEPKESRISVERKNLGFSSMEQSKAQQTLMERDFSKLKGSGEERRDGEERRGGEAERKISTLIDSLEGLVERRDYNNLNHRPSDRLGPHQLEKEAEESENTFELAKTPSSSIFCEPSNFLKESTRRDHYEIRKEIANESLFDESGVKDPPAPTQPMRKKKYSYSYLNAESEKENLQPFNPSLSKLPKESGKESVKESREGEAGRHKQQKIDRIMEMLQKSNSLGSKTTIGQDCEEEWSSESDVLKSNRLLRVELRDKELKISQLQQLLSRKEMEIEAQREVIKMLRDKNSSAYASLAHN